MFKCKLCGKSFTDLEGLYTHLEKFHRNVIPKDMSIPRYYYYMKTGKTNGNCVMCKQPTTWNKNTNKYNRFCEDPKCKEKYVAEFKKRMISKYGKVHLLNDPQKQREMLANRRISGTYRWDNGMETTYTGSFELDLIHLLDDFFEWDPVDISMPSPHTYTYMHDGVERYYIPDVFIHSLDLEIEIKDGGDNPNMHHKIQDVDKVKEKLKDEVLMSQKAFHYIKITNKNYTNFFNFLQKAKENFAKYGDDKKMPRIFLIEDIKTKPNPSKVKTIYEAAEVAVDVEDINNENYKAVMEFATYLECDNLVTESFIKDLEKQLISFKKLSVSDMEKIVSFTFDAKKDNQEEVQKYIIKLIKSSKSEKDMYLIKQLMQSYVTYAEKRTKENPDLKESEKEYKTWVAGDYTKEYDKKWKKIMESCDINEVPEVIMESSLNTLLSKTAKKLATKQINKIMNMSDKDIEKSEIKNVDPKDLKSTRDLLRAVNVLLKAVKTAFAIKAVIQLIKISPYLFTCFKYRKASFDEFSDALLKQAGKKAGVDVLAMMETLDFEDEEYLEESIDSALVWFDKPLKKLTNQEISLFHGSIDNIKDDHLTPSGVNVGATKFSTPRWSTYYFDVQESALTWAMTWATQKKTGIKCFYRGAVGKSWISRDGYSTDEELIKYLVDSNIEGYVYEVRIPCSKLEIGSVPSIKEYTLSEPGKIYKKTKVKLTKQVFNKVFEIKDLSEITEAEATIKVKDLVPVRNKILNSILNNYRDPYRVLVRREVKRGTYKVGDDISRFKNTINHAMDDDVMRLKEHYDEVVMTESTISIARINNLLAAEDRKHLDSYLDAYDTYYDRMKKERPEVIKNINADIEKALQVIDDMAKSGKVSNDLAKYARNRLCRQGIWIDPRKQDIVKEYTGVASLNVVVEPTQKVRAFGLMDSDTKIFIDDNHYFSRPTGLDSMNCMLKTDSLEANMSGKRVLKYNITPHDGSIDMENIIKKYISETLSIPGLFKLNEASTCDFIKDVCSRMGLTDCEITLVEDFIC